MSSSIILNIPHSSSLLPWDDIPAPYQEPHSIGYWSWGGRVKVKSRIAEKHEAEIPYMTDWYTDELFVNGIGKPLIAPVSRLLCDMERLKDDMKEEMSVVGMGICYTQTHDLEVLANFKFSHKMDMINKYYDPYHRTLCKYIMESRKEHKCVLVLDCHSFSSSPYKCDQNYAYGRPDICLGTDFRHTPVELVEILTGYFNNLGYSVKENYPFSGTIVPESFERDDNLLSVMIDVNKSLYLKWQNGGVKKKEEEFLKLKNDLCGAEKLIAGFVDKRCSGIEKEEERKKARKNDTEYDKLRNELEDAHEAAQRARMLKNAPVPTKDNEEAEKDIKNQS